MNPAIQKLIDSIGVPPEHAGFLAGIVSHAIGYAKQKGYSPFGFDSVPPNRYFCGYKIGAAARGHGAAIIGFPKEGSGLSLVFHYVVFDSKKITIKTQRDLDEGWSRIRIDREFTDEEVQHICKLVNQAMDRAFK